MDQSSVLTMSATVDEVKGNPYYQFSCDIVIFQIKKKLPIFFQKKKTSGTQGTGRVGLFESLLDNPIQINRSQMYNSMVIRDKRKL